MADMAKIFTPPDDSLHERVRSYRHVAEAYRHAEASMQHVDDVEWQHTLGDRQEIEDAYQTIRHSLKQATDAINREELIQAQEEKMLNKQEAIEFTATKRKIEMTEKRQQSQDSDFDSHQKRR